MKKLDIKIGESAHSVHSLEDHQTWALLNKRHSILDGKNFCKEYHNGLRKLAINQNKIIDIKKLSARLHKISGWTLVPVSGLIPTKDFFSLLIAKRYPITTSIRKPFEIDFSEQPDIYHDICGHLPLLTNQKFVKFLVAYSNLGLKYIDNEVAVELLGRLYWYTYEMGVIVENGEYKPYGGAVITSAKELANFSDSAVSKHEFNVEKILQTPYNPFDLQREYFVIKSFDELFNCLAGIEPILEKQMAKAISV